MTRTPRPSPSSTPSGVGGAGGQESDAGARGDDAGEQGDDAAERGGRGVTAEQLDQVVTWSVVRVSRFLGQRFAERLAESGLNPVQFGVLAYLAIEPEMTQADLARAVLVRPQSVATLLDALEQKGLIRRTGGRTRGRRNPVQLTDAGDEALRGVWEVALDTNDLRDAGLTTTEAAELNRLLLKIIGATRGTRLDGFYE